MAGSDVQGRNIDGLLHDIQGDGDQKNQEPDRQGETDGNVCLLPGVSHGFTITQYLCTLRQVMKRMEQYMLP